MRFKVNKKTGFITNDRELLIHDASGIPFYYRPNLKGRYKFNLPAGTYETNNNLTQLAKPCFYTLPKLKKPYIYKAIPNRFKIVYTNNPNKCSVDLNNGVIYFDHSFKNEPRFVKDFIKFHELGHYFYSGKGLDSEKDCDNFSAYHLIKLGYNPSQVKTASDLSLGDGPQSCERKNETFNFTQNFKQYGK